MKSNRVKYVRVLFLMLLLFPLNVFASNKIELKTDKTDLKAGDEIKVGAVVTENTDIYTVLATLKYDKNVFEKIDDKNFYVDESVSIAYNKENNKFGIINKTGKISMGGSTFYR